MASITSLITMNSTAELSWPYIFNRDHLADSYPKGILHTLAHLCMCVISGKKGVRQCQTPLAATYLP